MSTSAVSPEQQSPWLDPKLNCDIVMKGGITSGIVYPGAIVELAKRYRFRNIGGASAGAIAAAATAAAELGRDTDKGGFHRLDTVPNDLGMTDTGESRLLALFRPDPSTRRLFDAAIGFVRYGKLRAIWGLLRAFPRFPLLAGGLAAAAILLALLADVSWVLATAVIAVTPWILLIGLLRDAFRAFGRVADNDFGLCRLGPSATGGEPALTLWLYDLLQTLAGKPGDSPLTFADLWGVPLPASPDELTDTARQKLKELGWNAAERTIDLQVMTTNLTNGRPMRLPVGRDEHEDTAEDGGGFLFDPEEWERFFPPEVMKHLMAYSSVPDDGRAAILAAIAPGRNLRELPTGYALPVVVAARLSLSFPVLISAVPVWDIRFRTGTPHQLRCVLFSDGGISSNFPVHFFDSPLPRRPTFAINLAGFEPGEGPDPNDPAASVVDPVPATGRGRDTWKEIDSMFSFFVAIKDAMQNWRDNAQTRLPGFRERVIHVKLAGGEGGLNLGMTQDMVDEINDRGRYAGQKLVELFSGAPADQPPTRATSWDEHRWTRLRVTLSVLDRLLRSVTRGYAELDDGDTVTRRYADRIELGTEKPYAYDTVERLDFAKATVASYDTLVRDWGDDSLDDPNRPHPIATLRAVPPV
jgi:predicted acylesterase/phospholipase RssA